MSDQKPWEMDWSKASAAPEAPKPWERNWSQPSASGDSSQLSGQPVALPGQEKAWLRANSDPGTQRPTIKGSDEPTILGELEAPFKEGGPVGLSDESKANIFGQPGNYNPIQAINRTLRPVIEGAAAAPGLAARAAEGLNRAGVEAMISVLPDSLIKQEGKDLPASVEDMRRDLNLMAEVAEMLSGTETGALAKLDKGGVSPALRPQAAEASKAGYVLPPAMAVREPGALASLMSGEGGKNKLWQAASHYNQANTTKLATKDLGLPEGTALTPQAFDNIRKQVGTTRKAIEQILPDMETGQDFRAAIDKTTDAPAELQKAFPNLTKTNPKIADLQRDLLASPTMSASNAIELTRRLRSDATKNFKVPNDPDAHALAVAQIRASDAIEDQIERSIKDAPRTLAANIKTINKSYDDTLKELSHRRELQRVQPTQGADIRRLEKQLSDLASKKEDALAKSRRIQDVQDRNKILEDYRDARKLAAKSYDVEMATNPATGEVSAQRLAALRRLGRPLSGDLETIANSFDAFSPALQNTAKFGGGVEDWSVLDTSLALHEIGKGNIGGAVAALSRPAFRRTVLSPGYQKKMIAPEVRPAGIKQITAPSYVPIAGSVSMPKDQE